MADELKPSGTDHVDREKVYEDWKSGMKRKAIAEKHEMKEETVKSWIARDFKKRGEGTPKKKGAPTKKKGTPPKDKGTPPPKKMGAPKGNKNAVGNKGKPQPRNNNNYKHGAYSSVYWDTLDAEEIALLESLSYDEEVELESQIGLLTIRERRLLQQIKIFKEKEGGLTINSVTLRDLTIQGNAESDNGKKHVEKTTRTIATLDVILKLEATLTQVQAKKTKCLESLHKIRSDRADREEKAKEKEAELGDKAMEDVLIYLPEVGEIE